MSPRTWTFVTLALLLGAGLATAQADPLPSPLHGPRSGAPEESYSHAGNGTGNHTNDTLPPPSVTPGDPYVTGPYGATLSFQVRVKNVAHETQDVTFAVDAPLGWTVRLSANNTTLAPGHAVLVSGTVSSLSPLPAEGDATLHFHGRDAESLATLHACFSSPAYACPPASGGNGTHGGNGTGGNGTGNGTGGNGTHGGNGTGGNGTGNGTHGGNGTSPPPTQPPSNQTQPPQNETSPPANDTQQAPSSPAAQPSRPERVVRVEVTVRTRVVRTAWTGQGSVPSV